MTKDEALKMAIEWIELECRSKFTYVDVLNACKEALEQPVCNPHPKAPHGFNRDASHSADRYVCECEGWQVEQPAQEPFTWMEELQVEMYLCELSDGNKYCLHKKPSHNNGRWLPLYTHPHQWQGLTDDEAQEIMMELKIPVKYGGFFKEFHQTIEAKLKEKNHVN